MGDTTNRVAGFAVITIDGTAYALAGDLGYRVSGSKRDVIGGQDSGFHGYQEMPQPGMITFKGRDTGGLSQVDIEGITNSTVQCQLANGKQVIGRNMVRTGDVQKVGTEDATYEFELTGPDVKD
jgi:hypothetical protein